MCHSIVCRVQVKTKMKGGDREQEQLKDRERGEREGERDEVEDRHEVRAETCDITPIANWPFSV